MSDFDFSGWATRNDLLCSDGRTIRKDAFIDNDGEVVPVVWNHQHDDPFNVLGHALLKNCDEGVRTYIKFNEDTEQGRNAKALVEHGDVSALSIFANNLKQRAGDVLHGSIKEVSLVLAGANPGAFIDSCSFAHGEEADEEAIIYTGETLSLYHSDSKEEEKDNKDEKEEKEEKEKETVAEETKDDKTLGEVFDTLNEEQKTAVYAIVGGIMADNEDDDEGDDNEMKHNVFENEVEDSVLTHSDMQKIFSDAKRCGSLREAVEDAVDGGVLMHSIDTTGMETATGNQRYGFNDASMLFPDFKSVSAQPEWISRRMDWVQKVMSGVHHTPFSRIKSMYANITEDDARAKGYIKGRQKKDEVFTTLKRTTSPQTIYKKQKLDRDDVLDITDFDVVAWVKSEMRVMLDEEIARAILIGDGRNSASDEKINEINVRPIATDVPLYNTQVAVTVAANATSDERAKAMIDSIIRARKNYKGSGNPTFYTTEDVLTEMLLVEDGIGHKLYKTEQELATALRVKDIVTVEPMENQTISIGNDDDLPLLGVIVNLADYNVGADKGGEVNLFDDFDINYNQQLYLIETRISGALIKPFSALTFALKETE